jgi:hypothetical protein
MVYATGNIPSGTLNLRAYKDVAAENRPEGYTARVTFVISPAAPTQTATTTPALHK